MMPEMRKLRVKLTDADGKVHAVVMWAKGADSDFGLYSDRDQSVDGTCWYAEIGDEVPIEPVVVLPTGLGAVVEVTYPGIDTERFVRVEDDWWYPTGVLDPAKDAFFDTVSYTVLSEGVSNIIPEPPISNTEEAERG